MRGLIIVQHQVHGVCAATDEDDLHDGEVERRGRIEGP